MTTRALCFFSCCSWGGPLGYSIVSDLRKKGVKVFTSYDSEDGFRELVRSGRGTVIASPDEAREISRENDFNGRIKIHPSPIPSKSYYLVFSRKSPLSGEEMEILWKGIVETRQDGDISTACC